LIGVLVGLVVLFGGGGFPLISTGLAIGGEGETALSSLVEESWTFFSNTGLYFSFGED